jgi:hypothetical protein
MRIIVSSCGCCYYDDGEDPWYENQQLGWCRQHYLEERVRGLRELAARGIRAGDWTRHPPVNGPITPA